MKTYKTVEEYMADVPKEFLLKLKEMRTLAKELVPNGVESIKYGMPTIELNGKNLIHFASMKGHLGFYPIRQLSELMAHVDFAKSELEKSGIDFSKGCIRLPYTEPLPIKLITKIIKFRLKEEKR